MKPTKARGRAEPIKAAWEPRFCWLLTWGGWKGRNLFSAIFKSKDIVLGILELHGDFMEKQFSVILRRGRQDLGLKVSVSVLKAKK